MVNFIRPLALVAFLLLATAAHGEEAYRDDYAQDNLYHDYAQRQQEKQVPKGGGFGRLLMGVGLGWIGGGRFHSRRVRKQLSKKFQNDQKNLYTQYYNDVYTLQEQNAQLIKALEEMGVKLK